MTGLTVLDDAELNKLRRILSYIATSDTESVAGRNANNEHSHVVGEMYHRSQEEVRLLQSLRDPYPVTV